MNFHGSKVCDSELTLVTEPGLNFTSVTLSWQRLRGFVFDPLWKEKALIRASQY